MHSHDRTLLASLGFQDPDRRSHLHDLACRYMTQEPVARRIFDVLAPHNHNLSTHHEEFELSAEVPISKGLYSYKTTIGFVDVILRRSVLTNDDDPHVRRCRRWDRFKFEVKTARISHGDLLRQIKLYREYDDYVDQTKWFLATPLEVSDALYFYLAAEGIGVLRLGPRFDEFVANAAQTSATVASVAEV